MEAAGAGGLPQIAPGACLEGSDGGPGGTVARPRLPKSSPAPCRIKRAVVMGHAKFRQGLRAECAAAARQYGDQADHRALLHAVGALDPGQGIVPDIVVEESANGESRQRIREADLDRHLDNDRDKDAAPAKEAPKPQTKAPPRKHRSRRTTSRATRKRTTRRSRQRVSWRRRTTTS